MNSRNSTVIDPDSGDLIKVIENNKEDAQDLFKALQNAGSSYGITTEFLYRIYPGPEVMPALMFVYIENQRDLRSLDKVVLSGLYHVHLGLVLQDKFYSTVKSAVRMSFAYFSRLFISYQAHISLASQCFYEVSEDHGYAARSK